MIKIEMEPVDVLFFKTAQPFDPGGSIDSVFPPFPHTIASSIAAKLWSFSGKSIYDTRIFKSFYGPFFEIGNQILFPTPLNILKSEIKFEKSVLYFGKVEENLEKLEFKTNLEGEITPLWFEMQKIEVEETGKRENLGGFITLEGLKKWLVGDYENLKIEEDFVKEIYEKESRLGIGILPETYTTETGQMYRINFLRFKKDIKIVCWFEFEDEKDREILEKEPKFLQLGTERRQVRYEIDEDDTLIKELEGVKEEIKKSLKNSGILKILYLSPGLFLDGEKTKWKPDFDFGKIKSCCIGEKINIGKWYREPDGNPYGRGILFKGIPAGSIFYLKAEGNTEEIVEKLWLKEYPEINNSYFENSRGLNLTMPGVEK